jgi:hypothetical protein
MPLNARTLRPLYGSTMPIRYVIARSTPPEKPMVPHGQLLSEEVPDLRSARHKLRQVQRKEPDAAIFQRVGPNEQWELWPGIED